MPPFHSSDRRVKSIDLSRLCLSIMQSRMALRRPRQERVDAVRQYVGAHYSDEGPREAVPVNMISLYCKTVGRALMAKNPRVLLSTFDAGSKAAVEAMEQWCNEEVQRQNLAGTLQRVVLDALFSVGIAKVALATPSDAATVGWSQPVGHPFCERVDLDDFVFDTHAKDLSEAGFIGHRVRVPVETVRGDRRFSKARRDLAPSDDPYYNAEGDERINTIGRTFFGSQAEDWKDYVDLWEIYIPAEKLILTVEDYWVGGQTQKGDGAADPEPLGVQEWLGPDCGPYHFLFFKPTPGNAMPGGPVQDLIDLHLSINNIYRKLIRQAQRNKEVAMVAGGATEDGDRVVKANDGEMIRVDNPQSVNVVSYGAPNAGIFQLVVHLNQMFSYMGGNLDAVGGLSPQARTASQDEMLQTNANSGIADMQEVTTRFTSGVMEALCWYWFHHPTLTMRVKHTLPGMPDLGITRTVNPARRQASRWDDLHIKVDPYSIQPKTPQKVLAELNQIVSQIVVPMTPVLLQQGVTFDVNSYLDKVAKYLDLPDVKEIMSITSPPDPGAEGGGGAGGQTAAPAAPATTTRNYVRRSLGGGSQQAQGAELASSLAGQAAAGQSNGSVSPAQLKAG